MSQTSYSDQAPKAQAGMLGANNEGAFVRSLAFEGTAPLEFGLAVVVGTNAEKQVLLPSAASQLFRGVSVHQHPLEDETVGGINTDEMVGVMSQGAIWCQAVEAMAPGDTVHFIHTGGDEGKFRNDVDGGNADPVAAAEVLEFDADSSLVLINFNLP